MLKQHLVVTVSVVYFTDIFHHYYHNHWKHTVKGSIFEVVFSTPSHPDSGPHQHLGWHKGTAKLHRILLHSIIPPVCQPLEIYNPTPPHKYSIRTQSINLLNTIQITKDKQILFSLKTKWTSLGFLIRLYLHLDILQLQRRILSPAEITRPSLPGFGSSHAQKSKFLLLNPAMAHYQNTISAKPRFSISLWLRNWFLFCSMFLGREQRVRTPQQLRPHKAGDANTEALSPTNLWTPWVSVQAPAARSPRPRSRSSRRGNGSPHSRPHSSGWPSFQPLSDFLVLTQRPWIYDPWHYGPWHSTSCQDNRPQEENIGPWLYA